MKKRIVLGFLILVLILVVGKNNVLAANINNTFYSYYITNKYESLYDNVTDESSYNSYYGDDGDYSTLISFSAYKVIFLKPYTQTDLDKRIKIIKENYADEEHMELTSISGSLIELNGVKGYRITYYTTYSFSDMEYGYDLYELRSDNYDYSINISSGKNFINSAEEKKIVNSFKIKDTVLRSKNIPFVDVASNAWYYNAVKYAYENKIISGYNAYTFGPEDKLTRGQLVTILHRMEKSPKVTGTSKFSDVKDSKQYYYNAVIWATNNKIVSGYDNGKFGPDDNITREQLAVILWKYAKYKGKSVTASNNLSAFKDKNKISSWALGQVKWAVGAGVISGNADKTLNPQGNATRAEVAAMLEKYCKKVGR